MTAITPPPATGPYAYNAFVPAEIAGAGYVDPVFGATVRRVTRDHGRDNIYARNMMWCANGRQYLHRTEGVPGKPDAWDVIIAETGDITHTGLPFGSIAADGGFDPVDPDIVLALSGNDLLAIRLLANGQWSVGPLFSAPSALRDLGGSINWISANGETMLVRYGDEPSARVYARGFSGSYANPIDASYTVGKGSYLGITPDGQYVVGFDSRPIGESHVGQGVSWKINHGARSVETTPTPFWSLCGDHGAFCSASDGRNYFITYACYNKPGLWRVDITNNANGLDEAAQMLLPNNKLLIEFDTWNEFGHVTTVARGPLKDWAFIATEDGTDLFDGPTEPWHPYRQEIIAVNVITGELRGLAHHRSRSLDWNSQPRVSCSWEGEWVGYLSNFNQRGVVDVFAIPFAASDPGPVPPEPTPGTLPISITIGGRRYIGVVVEK